MSFSGKRFKRVGCNNIDNLIKATSTNENIIQMLKCNAPTFSFTRVDQVTFNLALQMDSRVMSHNFTLGEEHEMEKNDGTKVKITYTLEGDNVLKQTIKQKDGKIAHFRREFGQKHATMTVTMEGTDVEATIYYELVE